MQAALAPAEGLKIEIDEAAKLVTVTAPDDQLSLAIGKGGQNVRIASKLVGYKITITSAEGDVKSSVTGEEEHEIDTFEDLETETRDKLVQFKLTTLADLFRFKAKWQDFDDITDSQKELLAEKVEEFERSFDEAPIKSLKDIKIGEEKE